jgi:4-hydroxythreonine-4-phosphate dehydrogenase
VTGGIPRIAITPGEPAGIGPDLAVAVAMQSWPAELIVVADPDLIARRAEYLGVSLKLLPYDESRPPQPSAPGELRIVPMRLAAVEQPGTLNAENNAYVLETLTRACTDCLAGKFQAMVTGPVHKGVINQGGVPFSGHTEFLAGLTRTPLPVMLLVAGNLRVALVTTHLALRDVPAAITAPRIENILRVLAQDLQRSFGIPEPRIAVLGLNPHAGESGHLGTEERTVIEPVIARLRAEGFQLLGPLPADTAFTPAHLNECDAVLAMFHDQGLPVLKNRGFGRAVNITLGLPVIRTSVDHGTALDLAGTGRAHDGSMRAAIALAIELSAHRQQ